MSGSSGAIAQAAQALLAAAREHKRAVRIHREAAQKCMQDLTKLRQECALVGIKLEVA